MRDATSGQFTGNLARQARDAGKTWYSGEPCAKDPTHGTNRRSATGECLKCRNKRSGLRQKLVKGLQPEKYLWISARNRCKKSKVPFLISVEDVKKVWPEGDICPVLKIPLQINTGPSGRRGPSDNSPTLDRKKPELGYVVGNIAVISHKANRIKNNETDPVVLRKIADWLETCGA